MRWIFIFIMFGSALVQAQEAPNAFLGGVKAYQSQDFTKAQELLVPLLQEHPENPAILYNLGLVEYQLGNAGMALGLWRKARFLDQSLKPTQLAIEYAEEQLFPDPSPPSFIVVLYNSMKRLPFEVWGALCLLSFFLGAWFAVDLGIKKRRHISLWPAWIYFILPVFFVSSFFAFQLYYERQQTLGTVITQNQLTRANPSETAPTLSELSEGQVVVIEKTHGPWLQVRTLKGSPGWVPQTSIIAFRRH